MKTLVMTDNAYRLLNAIIEAHGFEAPDGEDNLFQWAGEVLGLDSGDPSEENRNKSLAKIEELIKELWAGLTPQKEHNQ